MNRWYEKCAVIIYLKKLIDHSRWIREVGPCGVGGVGRPDSNGSECGGAGGW